MGEYVDTAYFAENRLPRVDALGIVPPFGHPLPFRGIAHSGPCVTGRGESPDIIVGGCRGVVVVPRARRRKSLFWLRKWTYQKSTPCTRGSKSQVHQEA